ncbi:MAG TPA: Rrf2 family transcriptional regulator [Melioribacteraceae bacterium]|nr:Rrf2 family transcriptional regulator [Melioribacteraceae bacterium]
MKFSSQEEYSLRLLLRIAKFYKLGMTVTIPELSKAEGISQHNAAKLLRLLRLGGFIESERGANGGYYLSKTPDKIKVIDVLNFIGGRLFDDTFCNIHAGENDICNNSIDCSVRSLWRLIQNTIDNVLQNLTLEELTESEEKLFLKY